MSDLNKILDYTLRGNIPVISQSAQRKVDNHVIVNKDDWFDSFAYDFKKELKIFYARKQGQKCAYCRTPITSDAYGEPVEHITPRHLKPWWMFVKHNLLVSCGGCNSFKNTDNILEKPTTHYGNLPVNCPDDSKSYYIFNPHFDKWSDHFEIEDVFFIKPKENTKGPFTYKCCGMNRYQIITDYIFMLRIRKPFSFKILNARIRKERDPEKLSILKKALECINETIAF